MRAFFFFKAFFYKIKTTFFYKLVAFFIIAVCIPAIGISMLSIKFSTDNFIKQESNANASILLERMDSFNRSIKEVDSLIFQLAAFSQTWKLLTTEEPLTTYDKSTVINEMLEAIRSGIAKSDMIQSIYIYSSNHDFVLANTKYNKKDFFDSGVFNIKMSGNTYIGIRQATIPNNKMLKNKVVTYIRKFDNIFAGDEVYFLINLKYDNFFSMLSTDESKNPMGFLVFDKDYAMVYSENSLFSQLGKPELTQISEGGDSFVKNIDVTKYFICKTHSDISSWTLVFIQPYEEILKTAGAFRNMIVIMFLIILALSIFMVYYFSRNLYTPLNDLVKETAEYSDFNQPEGKNRRYRTNEYKIIDGAIKKLLNQNNRLISINELSMPYLRNNFINNLLSDETFDAEKFKSILELLGAGFVYDKYSTVVADFENVAFTGAVQDILESFLSGYRGGMDYVLSNISGSRVVILINTEYDNIMFNSMIIELKNSFNRKNIYLTISTGKQYQDINGLYLSYMEALQQIQNKFFIGKNEIISYYGIRPANQAYFYDKGLEDEMLGYIKLQNKKEAVGSLEKLTGQLKNNASSIGYIKYVYFQVINNIVYELENLGVQSEDTEMSNTYIFEKIDGADTLENLKQMANKFIEKSIDLLVKFKERKHSDFVKKTIEYISLNFNMDLSLQEISEKIFLSPRYLNSIFKEETGMTIFNYITRLRMEKAKMLMDGQNCKIQDIAGSVGYNNVQSFIKFFKKYYGMTPTDYRRKFIQQTEEE